MAGFDFLSGDSWMPAAASLVGGLLGSQSTDSSSSSTRSMDPRMDRYVYGQDGQSGLLSDAFGLYSKQASQGGLNDLQRQGMGMQQQYLMSPQYQQGYANMASLGNALMGGGVAGNPFTQQPQMYGQPGRNPAYDYPSGWQSGSENEGGLVTTGDEWLNDGRFQAGGTGYQYPQQPSQGGSNISAPPVNGSVADKAAWYRSQQAAGLSDDQIRAAVNSQVGQQSDTDWGYLRGVAGSTPQAQAPVIRGNQQQLPAFNYDWSQIPGTGMAKLPDYKSAPGLLSPANQQVVNQLNAGAANGGGGSGGNATGNGGGFSIGVGQMTDAINSSALSAAQKAALLGLPAAAIAGLYSQYTASHGFMDAINQAADPIGALAAAQGWTDTDPGYNAWGGGYSDSGGGWGNGGYGFGGGTGGMGD